MRPVRRLERARADLDDDTDGDGGAVTRPDPEELAPHLAGASLAAGDPTGWFERLYAAADRGRRPSSPGIAGRRTSCWCSGPRTTGCAAADDAPSSSAAGSALTPSTSPDSGSTRVAFDVAPAAVAAARSRHPHSPVDYRVADLLALPDEWLHAFDLVVETLTVQSLPVALREQATAAVADLVAPGGTLLVVAAARDDDSPADGPPWPLTRAKVDAFAGDGLEPVRVEDLRDATQPTVRRWRAEFRG